MSVAAPGAPPPSTPSTTTSPTSPTPAAAAAPPSRQEIERRLSVSLPAAPKPQPPMVEVTRPFAIRPEGHLSESDELDEGEEDEDEEDEIEDEDGEIRRRVDEERVLRSGTLEKKGEQRRTWKKRWFVLRTGKLSFYKDSKEYKLLRIIDLHDVHLAFLVEHKKYTSVLGIVTAQRTFYLKARDRAEAEAWIADVNAAKKDLQERGSHVQSPTAAHAPQHQA